MEIDGVLYAHGEGVAKNDVESIYWYRKAEDQGFNEAIKIIKNISKDDKK